jgi:hypothetical protein
VTATMTKARKRCGFMVAPGWWLHHELYGKSAHKCSHF